MGNTKYTYAEMSLFFKKANCELLESTYKNAHQPLKFRCECGSISAIRWNSFRDGGRCANCSKTKQPCFVEVKNMFEKHGCLVLETEYVNSRDPMKFKCKCGNVHQKGYYAFCQHPFCNQCGKTNKLSHSEVSEIYQKHNCELLEDYQTLAMPMKFKCKCGRIDRSAFAKFRRSPQCRTCSGRHIYSYDEVVKLFHDNKCTLLETTYKNVHSKMKYKCTCGNVAKISLEKLKSGQKCKKCGIRSGEKSGRWNPDRELVRLNKTMAIRSLGYLKRILKLQGMKKDDHMVNLLGYTVTDLRNHITTHPNWDKVKDGKWHIDHIFPTKAFLEHGITDIKLINALDNLQPLSQKDNLVKSDKYNKKEFLAWISNKQLKSD